MLIVQIESVEVYQNLDATAQVPGIDVLFVGPMDLSASLGVITNMQHKEVQSIMQDVARRYKDSHLVVGTTLSDVSEMQEKIGWGYRFMNVGSPLGYGLGALRQHVATLRANPAGN